MGPQNVLVEEENKKKMANCFFIFKMYLAPVTSLETFSNVGKRGKLEAGIHAVARDAWLLFSFYFFLNFMCLCCFESGSHTSQIVLELNISTGMTLNFWSSCPESSNHSCAPPCPVL